MTRDEEIITACKSFLSRYPSIDQAGLSIGFLDGAVFADNNPPQGIVNLNNVWHNASEEPQGDNYKILCVDDYDLYWMAKRAGIIGLFNNWEEYTVIEGVKMWAYINDLLPKQFGNSERLKGEHNGNND